MSLLALAERCERAEGPDRRLDAEIDWTARDERGAWYVAENYRGGFSHVSGWWRDADDRSHKAPEYTASLDAALTLVPEGWAWELSHNSAPGGYAKVYQELGYEQASSAAATPALALCAAALRAHHAIQERQP
jgi:hypothetical protein